MKVRKKVFDQLVDYQDICDFIEDETMNPDGSYNMSKIIEHRTTGRKNQIVQVLVQWKSGECTYEPISRIYKGDRFMVWLSTQEITVYWKSGSHHALS